MDTWQAPFRNGMVCYDADAKELVRISNGRCVKPHDPATYDGHMANGGCTYVPHEAIALRVVGIAGKGDPVVAFTHRGVRAEALTPASDDAMVDPATIRRSRFAGRV